MILKSIIVILNVLISIAISALVLGSFTMIVLSIGPIPMQPIGSLEFSQYQAFSVGGIIGGIHGLTSGIIISTFEKTNALVGCVSSIFSIAIMLFLAFVIFGISEQYDWSIFLVIQNIFIGIIMYIMILLFLVIPFSVMGLITGAILGVFNFKKDKNLP